MTYLNLSVPEGKGEGVYIVHDLESSLIAMCMRARYEDHVFLMGQLNHPLFFVFFFGAEVISLVTTERSFSSHRCCLLSAWLRARWWTPPSPPPSSPPSPWPSTLMSSSSTSSTTLGAMEPAREPRSMIILS